MRRPSAEPREIIERLTTPRGELQLQRRGEDFEVISNGCFLMATYNGGSEAAMVSLAAGLAPGLRRVLVGGLGVGFTLRAALDWPGVEAVTVVEIEPAVAGWNRAWLAPYNGFALEDSRVKLVIEDLGDFLDRPPEPFDLIALDTDNGPDWTVFDANAALWSEAGLARLERWLAPGGVLAFWSASASPPFEATLRRRFGRVEAHAVAAAVTDTDDLVYLASR